MDFEYTKEQTAFRNELREWLHENLPAGWLDGDRSMMDDPDDRIEFLLDWQRTLYEGGWAGIHWPEEYGGADASLMEQVIYEEELARVDAPPQINAVGINFVGPTLLKLGTETQRERFLTKIISGEELWCQGYSEPEAGSDLGNLSLSAERNGDNEFVLNGQKVWTSYAHTADWCFLLTRTDDSSSKHHGITVFLVDMDQPEIRTEPIHQITDEREFNETFFDDAVAKEKHIVGEIDEGWEVAMTLSAFEHSMSDVFSIEQRWRSLVDFCQETERDGKPLAEHSHVDANWRGSALASRRASSPTSATSQNRWRPASPDRRDLWIRYSTTRSKRTLRTSHAASSVRTTRSGLTARRTDAG